VWGERESVTECADGEGSARERASESKRRASGREVQRMHQRAKKCGTGRSRSKERERKRERKSKREREKERRRERERKREKEEEKEKERDRDREGEGPRCMCACDKARKVVLFNKKSLHKNNHPYHTHTYTY